MAATRLLQLQSLTHAHAQCTTIFRNYDKERSGKLSFQAFCNVFAEDPTGDEGGACARRALGGGDGHSHG